MTLLEVFETSERPCLVVAHPDDETLSSSQLIHALRFKIQIVFVTGDEGREAEAKQALSVIGLPHEDQVHFLQIDEGRIYELTVQLNERLQDALDVISPDIVVTHAFEGGHFDHDLVRFFMELLHGERPDDFTLAQFALYFCQDGVHHHNIFIDPHPDDIVLTPSSQDLERKKKMIAAYSSQQEYLRFFDPENSERLRLCADEGQNPQRFLHRPHRGSIGYDHGVNSIKTWKLFTDVVNNYL